MKKFMFYSKRKLPDIAGGKDFFIQNGVIVFLLVMFLCGLITGVSVYLGADRERDIITLFAERYVSRSPLPFFANDLVVTSVLLLSAALAGVGAAGTPFVAAVPFVKGLLIGILSAYFIGTDSAAGYGCYALTVVPGGCICTVAVLYMCEMCCSVSCKVFRLSFCDSREKINGARFLIICGICLVAGAASCTVDLLMRLIFGGIFRLG